MGFEWRENLKGVNNIVIRMFTFLLCFFLALSNNWGMRWKVKTKSTCNSWSGFPLWEWIEIWKLELQYDFIFSSRMWFFFSSLFIVSRLQRNHWRKKWCNNWRLFMRRFSDYGKKKPTSISFSLRSRRYCVMQFCLCCTNKGSQVLCTWQWISLSHWMDAMMT